MRLESGRRGAGGVGPYAEDAVDSLLAETLGVLTNRSVVVVGARRGDFARRMLVAGAETIQLVEAEPRNVEFLRARFCEEPRVVVHTSGRPLDLLVADGLIPARTGILRVGAARRELEVVVALGCLDCDVVAVDHWLELPPPLGGRMGC